jgi:tetratricopeptide (TPR) repeat protein
MKREAAQTLLLFAALMMSPVCAARAQDFYVERLRGGEAAYRQKDLSLAVDEFRIAAFGFLERPVHLEEALACLAVVQSAQGKPVESDAAISRFLEAELRFKAYAQVALEASIRAEFQALLLRRVAASTLQSTPGLASILEVDEQRLSKLPPRDRVRAYEEEFKRQPKNARWPTALAREAAAADKPTDAIVWATKALELDPSYPEALAIRAHAMTAKGEYARALVDFGRLTAEQWSARPQLLGDRFVCLVETKDWNQADQALTRVPDAERSRPDVAKAAQKLAALRRSP